MPDTMRESLKNAICSDCGERGCSYKYWGPMVPREEEVKLCWFCFEVRRKAYVKGESPKPLGAQPPGIPYKFIYKKVQVVTEDKSIYGLDLTERTNERIISCNGKELYFTQARVICLEIGRDLVLKPRDGSNFDLWCTSSRVISIEQN